MAHLANDVSELASKSFVPPAVKEIHPGFRDVESADRGVTVKTANGEVLAPLKAAVVVLSPAVYDHAASGAINKDTYTISHFLGKYPNSLLITLVCCSNALRIWCRSIRRRRRTTPEDA